MTPSDMARIHALAMTVPAPWTVQDFEDMSKLDGAFSVGKAQAGFALGRVVLDEAELLTLAVDPAVRRQGIGRFCLAAFEDKAAAHGAKSFHLEVARTNAAAITLYLSANWQQTGVRKAYYKAADARIDAILMTKRLVTD